MRLDLTPFISAGGEKDTKRCIVTVDCRQWISLFQGYGDGSFEK